MLKSWFEKSDFKFESKPLLTMLKSWFVKSKFKSESSGRRSAVQIFWHHHPSQRVKTENKTLEVSSRILNQSNCNKNPVLWQIIINVVPLNLIKIKSINQLDDNVWHIFLPVLKTLNCTKKSSLEIHISGISGVTQQWNNMSCHANFSHHSKIWSLSRNANFLKYDSQLVGVMN